MHEMATTQIKAGDIVILRSGGPDMAVVEVAGGYALCRWENVEGVTAEHRFPVECLDPAALRGQG